MLTRWTQATAVVVGGIFSCAIAHGYEPGTTHAGLTAKALMASHLHQTLRQDFGLELGAFSHLELHSPSISRRELHQLHKGFKRFDPSGGYRPDQRNGQGAALWLLAGSVLEGTPASAEKDHFYSPTLKKGLDDHRPLLSTLLRLLATFEGGDSARRLFTGTGFSLTGASALKGITAKDDPRSIQAFYKHLSAAGKQQDPRQRSHHLALALLGAGRMLHRLQDMASPTHVRNDFVTGHLERLGKSNLLRGSAYEHLVALAYGQHALPRYRGAPIKRKHLLDFFASPDADGLADLTNQEHFSPGTLPPPVEVLKGTDVKELRERLTRGMPLPRPVLGKIDLRCARERTCYQRGVSGPRLAYRVKSNQLRFYLDSRCYTATARRLLPLAVGYSTGLINYLLRGRLVLKLDQDELQIINAGIPLSAAKGALFLEDAQGRRELLAPLQLKLPGQRKQLLATFSLPTPLPKAGIKRLIVLIEGSDLNKQPLVATGQVSLP